MANFPTIAIGLPFVHSSGLSPQAETYRTNVIANGGSISDSVLTIIDTNLILPLVASGDFSNLFRLNIFAGLSGFQVAANTNLISSNFLITAVGSPTFDNNGYKVAATGKYLNLNFNPSINGFTQNSASMGYCVLSPPFNGQKDAMGITDNTNGNLIREFVLSIGGWFNGNFSGFGAQSARTGRTMIGLNRTTSANFRFHINTTTTTITNASNASNPLNLTMFELVNNNSGSPTTFFDTNYHSASWCGNGNLNTQFLWTCLQNTFSALGI
jgi:hypothetical protein